MVSARGSRRGGIQIIIVPPRRGQPLNITLPEWAFNLVLGAVVAIVVMLVGGVLLTARMGLELKRLRGAEAENGVLRAENAKVEQLEAEIERLDAFRERVLELAGAGGATAIRADRSGTVRAGQRDTARTESAAASRAPLPGGKVSLPTLWPVEGVISKGFRVETTPDREHHGLDIAAPQGTPVRAAGAGVVAFAGTDSVFGELVVIDHGEELQSLYGHNSQLEVEVGDWVEPGQEIARVGSTGESSAAHLHFEVRRKGQPIDPRRYLAP